MPLYRTDYAHAAERVAELEAEGEHVVNVAPDGDGLWIVTGSKKTRAAGGRETR